jgi:hypothetical protein
MRTAVVAESLFSSFEVYPPQPHHFSIADRTDIIVSFASNRGAL